MTDNDQRFADLAMKAANQRTHQTIEIAELTARITALIAAGDRLAFGLVLATRDGSETTEELCVAWDRAKGGEQV
jgi:hypothetical protein